MKTSIHVNNNEFFWATKLFQYFPQSNPVDLFDKSTRTWYKYILCSTHFSCNCLTEKIISVLLRPAHWHYSSTSLAICWSSRFNIILSCCGKLSEIFEVKNRVKQGDSLPFLLFAMVFYITFKNCDVGVYIPHLILGEC